MGRQKCQFKVYFFDISSIFNLDENSVRKGSPDSEPSKCEPTKSNAVSSPKKTSNNKPNKNKKRDFSHEGIRGSSSESIQTEIS